MVNFVQEKLSFIVWVPPTRDLKSKGKDVKCQKTLSKKYI